nr:MAG TPA: hypothetical protein [Caudoviricetes sp.]
MLSSSCFISCNSRNLSSPRFLIIFFSYSVLIFSASSMHPLGQVVQLHE